MFSGLMEAIGNFQFAAPLWLWGLLVLPMLWGLYYIVYAPGANEGQAADFADPHLLPHLLISGEIDSARKNSLWTALGVWSAVWAFGMLAMAGPRWDYTEIDAFSPSRNLVVLLDLSRSMDAEDVKPSRLGRARQEIEDLLRLGEGVNIGLIAFDSVPHVITPLTDDRQTLQRLLPAINTSLVYVQGGNLAAALYAARDMLGTEAGESKNVVVMSDGGFSDSDSAILEAQISLRASGIIVHVMGAGTVEGAPIPMGDANVVRGRSGVVVSRLERDRMRRIARDGKGIYLDMDYLEGDTAALLEHIRGGEAGVEAEQTTRFWEERYYIFLLPFAFLLLPWFRRHAVFPALLFAVMLHGAAPAQAAEWRQYFMNKEQQGADAFRQEDYYAAEDLLDDPYKQGVAQYKAGKFSRAIENFKKVDNPEILTDAKYNLGNAQLMGGKIREAIETYEKLLEEHPDHEDAKHNLEIAKKMLKRQEQDQPGEGAQSEDEDGDQSDQGDDSQDESDGGQDDRQDGGKNPDGENDESQQNENPDEQQDKQDNRPGEGPEEDDDEQDGNEDGGGQSEEDGEDQPEMPEPAPSDPAPDGEQGRTPQQAQRSQTDIDADQWLNRIENDPVNFLRQKFYIESVRQGAKQGDQPW